MWCVAHVKLFIIMKRGGGVLFSIPMGTHPTQETKSDGCHHVAIAMQHETGDGEFKKKRNERFNYLP